MSLSLSMPKTIVLQLLDIYGTFLIMRENYGCKNKNKDKRENMRLRKREKEERVLTTKYTKYTKKTLYSFVLWC